MRNHPIAWICCVALVGACAAAAAEERRPVRQLREVKPGEDLSGRETIPAPDDVAAVPADAERTASGLATKVLEPGTGTVHPGPNDAVLVHYIGWSSDGTMFDSTRTAGAQPRSFQVRLGIPGFAEGIRLMVEGERRRLWVPPELGYGDLAAAPSGMLVFDIELMGIVAAPAPPPDLAAAPEEAVRTESGLAYRVVQPGEGESPARSDRVLATFDVWTPRGELVDSPRMRNAKLQISLDQTVPAFSESFRSMRPGERRIVWSPAKLAALPGEPPPDGDLVFDLEMVSFEPRIDRPVDYYGAPRDAVTTQTGLAYRIVRAGAGERPPHGGTVLVRYAGWTPDGTLFDSSYEKGRPGVFKLDFSMPMGWNEAIRSMAEGEIRDVWIPKDLALGGGAMEWPSGPWMFRLELLDILE